MAVHDWRNSDLGCRCVEHSGEMQVSQQWKTMVVHLYTHFKVVCDGGDGVGVGVVVLWLWWCGVVGCSGVGWGVLLWCWWGGVVAVVGV